MRIGPWDSSEISLNIGDDAIAISQQPKYLSGPIQDEYAPPHPLVGPQPSEGAEEGD
jgi:hypothetical protein